MLSTAKISETERVRRTKLLKKIAYYTELYDWKGLKKLYAHIIRQIENELGDWSGDFSKIETPILIKYVKTEVKVKYGQSIDSKRDVYFCSAYQRKKCSHEKSHFGKFRSTD